MGHMSGVGSSSAQLNLLSWAETLNLRPGAGICLNSPSIQIGFSTVLVDKAERLRYQEGQLGACVTGLVIAFQACLLINGSDHR